MPFYNGVKKAYPKILTIKMEVFLIFSDFTISYLLDTYESQLLLVAFLIKKRKKM